MWGQLRTNAIAALTVSALALGATAPAHAMNDQTRDLIKGVAAAVIIGALLSNMGDEGPAPQPRYAPPPPPPPQPHTQPPRTQRHDARPETRPMAPPPRPAMTAQNSGRVIGGRFDPPPQPRAPQAGYDGQLRDYADRNGGPRGYDVPRLDQPPRQQPMR